METAFTFIVVFGLISALFGIGALAQDLYQKWREQ